MSPATEVGAPRSLGSAASPLTLERTGPPQNPAFDRRLLLDGRPAYHVGNVCNTCELLFERLDGANRSVDVPTLAEALGAGLPRLDTAIVEQVSAVLPVGEYMPALLNVRPVLVTPGDARDYFTHEQVATWGMSAFWDLPHHPRTRYYRGESVRVGAGTWLYEFVIPMYPPAWLDAERVAAYRAALAHGQAPTAVALSLLDVKAPAVFTGNREPEVHTHWCLHHYLLDGHHKVFAAAEAGSPITLLAFVHLGESVADVTEVERALALLAGGAPTSDNDD